MIVRGLDAGQITQAISRALAGADAPLRCVSDHRRVQAGDVWFAVPGQRFDPRTQISSAVLSQVGAVVAEAHHFPTDRLSEADASHCPVYLLEGLGVHAGPMAAQLLFEQTPPPRLIAVTGTNGKTSVTRWVAQALSYLGERCAVVGTLGAGFVDEALDHTGLTTPDAVSLQNAIASLGHAGARAVALEASSIGLDQGRLAGCRFSVGAFTNLSRDHLDYHGSMEAYERAKQRLFQSPDRCHAVINLDDPAAGRFLAVARDNGSAVLAVTASDAPAYQGLSPEAVLRVQGAYLENGMQLSLRYQGEEATISVPVVGQFNRENLAVVAGILLACGQALQAVADGLGAVTPPPGRMQMIRSERGPLVVVDYAHTPDALEKVLCALRPVSAARGGQLHCVFGCGGDRDSGKRPLMGAAAARLADAVVLTSDNPRSESPAGILNAILQGVESAHREKVMVLEDRAQAIEIAITTAQAADVVVLAGKGHETGQIVGDCVLPFSDIEVATDILKRMGAAV